MNSNKCERCAKKFWTDDRKRLLNSSLELCGFVFAHALLDVTRFVDVIQAINGIVCNSCYLSFYRKMKYFMEKESTFMEVGHFENRHTFREISVQTEAILISNTPIQCDDTMPTSSTMFSSVNPITMTPKASNTTISLLLYRLESSYRYCNICNKSSIDNAGTRLSYSNDDIRSYTLLNSHTCIFMPQRCSILSRTYAEKWLSDTRSYRNSIEETVQNIYY